MPGCVFGLAGQAAALTAGCPGCRLLFQQWVAGAAAFSKCSAFSQAHADTGPTPPALPCCSLAQRFPVQVRPRPPPLPGQAQGGKDKGGGKKKHRPGVKGGKLAPGGQGRPVGFGTGSG